jgi:hypothetical protein
MLASSSSFLPSVFYSELIGMLNSHLPESAAFGAFPVDGLLQPMDTLTGEAEAG